MTSPTVAKCFDTNLIIQRQRPTYKTSGQQFHRYKSKRFAITSTGFRKKVQATSQILVKGKLGFGPMEMGAHSLRSGAAMVMYLAVVLPLTIMIIGIWRSDAFLLYIRKQISQFFTKVSDKMVQNKYFSLSRTLTEQSKKQKMEPYQVH